MLLRQVTSDDRLDALLAIEDIHWADEATLDLLRFLTRRIRAARVPVIATYRDDWLEASSPLRLALGDLGAAVDSPGRAAAAAVHRGRGGPWPPGAISTPASCTTRRRKPVLRHRKDPKAVTDGVPLSARATQSVAHRTAQRCGPAGTGDGRAHGPAGRRGLLADRPTALDELCASGLLVDEAFGLRFRHEIGRLAIAQEIPAHRQAVIHAEILSALHVNGSRDDARMAFHAEGAGDEEAVVRHASLAAKTGR